MNHREYKKSLGKKLKEMTNEERKTYNRLANGGPLVVVPRERKTARSKAEYRRKRRKAGKDQWFKQQDKEYHYAAAHHSKMRTRHPVARNSSLTTGLLAEWIRSSSQECYLCGTETLGIDHVVPLSRGGEHELYNMRICCPSCNSIKRDSTLQELRSSLPNKKVELEQTIREIKEKLEQLDTMEGRLERLS